MVYETIKKNSNFIIGLKNEDQIAKYLPIFVSENNDIYSVSDISECGIVANRDHDFLHTSTDRLCWLNVCPSNAMIQPEKLFVCIEMKTVTQESTSTAALNRIREIPVGRRFITVSFVSEQYHTTVLHSSTTWQRDLSNWSKIRLIRL